MIEEAMIARGAADGGILWRGPEETQRRAGAVSRLGAGDPAAFHADRVGGEREPDRRDARELQRGPAVRREAVRGRRQVPEEIEGAMLECVEEGDRVGRNARAPGVIRETAPEGQNAEGNGAAGAAIGQNVYSMPICTRRGSLITWRGSPTMTACRAGAVEM